MIPNTQNDYKYPLKIKYLQVLGVGGVEGVGHSACMTTIYARERFSPQVQLDLQSSWSEYKDLQSDYRIPIFNICGRRNPYESCIFI